MTLLHIYAQPHFHEDAIIVGSREGLIALREAVMRALEVGSGAAELTLSDGEGYNLVVLRDEKAPCPVPYTEEWAQDHGATVEEQWRELYRRVGDALKSLRKDC